MEALGEGTQTSFLPSITSPQPPSGQRRQSTTRNNDNNGATTTYDASTGTGFNQHSARTPRLGNNNTGNTYDEGGDGGNSPVSNNPPTTQQPIGLPSYMPTTGSLGVAGVNKHSIGVGCCNSPTETVEALVATSLYFHFESLVRETLAKEAALFLYQPTRNGQGDECQAIALFGGKPRPPSNVKVSIKTGVVGAVIRTGFAISITPENPTETNDYALCFPIFPVNGRSAPIGAVMLEKKAGGVPFTKADELVTHQWTKLASHFISEYGVNLTQVYFDPHRTLLKKTKPAAVMHKRGVHKATPRWIESGPEATVEGNVEQLMQRFSGVYSPRLAQMVVAHPTDQLLFRAVHHNHFTTIRGGHIGGSGVTLQTQNLVDVADYVVSLEECWKRAADDLQGMEVEHVSRMDDFRERKKKLKASQIRMGQLEAVCDHYKTKYEGIKRELTVLCGAPVDEDGLGAAGSAGTGSSGGGGVGMFLSGPTRGSISTRESNPVVVSPRKATIGGGGAQSARGGAGASGLHSITVDAMEKSTASKSARKH